MGFCEGHCQTNRLARIVLMIGEDILAIVSFLKDTSLDVMDKHFTLPHMSTF